MIFVRGVLLAFLFCFAIGCGESGGSPGDVHDPATTSDEEQMQDETGEVN